MLEPPGMRGWAGTYGHSQSLLLPHGEVIRPGTGQGIYHTDPRGNLARTSILPYWMLYLPLVLILALMTGLITVLPLLVTVQAVWMGLNDAIEGEGSETHRVEIGGGAMRQGVITACDDGADADHVRGESGHDVEMAVLDVRVGVRVCCHLKLAVAGRGSE